MHKKAKPFAFLLFAVLTGAVVLLPGFAAPAAGNDREDLAAALSVPEGVLYKTLVASRVIVVGKDTTVPARVSLRFENGGGFLVKDGVTLTVNGSVEVPMQQVFQGGGKVVFGPGRIKEVYPQWWGAKGDGKSDDTAAIQAAIDSITRGTVFFPSGTYANTGITVKSFTVLKGANMGASKLLFTPKSGSCITLPKSCGGFRFEDMSLGSSARSSGYGIDGTKEWVRYFSMRNFIVTGFKHGVYIQAGGHISIDYGYISCYGMGAANGTVGLQLGDRARNRSCTTVTVKDVYFTNAETCFYNRTAPCAIIRPIFETCQIGLDTYTRATVLEPFFAGCKKAAARMTDNGVFFVGPFPTEYKFIYASSAERNRTSFFPDTFDSPMKLGPMHMTPKGELTIAGRRVPEGPKQPSR